MINSNALVTKMPTVAPRTRPVSIEVLIALSVILSFGKMNRVSKNYHISLTLLLQADD